MKKITERQEHIAARFISREWINSAKQIIARGENPAKLTDTLKNDAIFFGFIEEAAALFFSGYLHDEITLTKAAVKRIKAEAIGEARFQITHDEDHKVVLEHFIARQKNA
jgi:hypothetical protein